MDGWMCINRFSCSRELSGLHVHHSAVCRLWEATIAFGIYCSYCLPLCCGGFHAALIMGLFFPFPFPQPFLFFCFPFMSFAMYLFLFFER